MIEFIRFIHLIYMPVSKLFLDGPAKSLQTIIRFRMSGIIKEVSQVISLTVVIEMFGKFTSIITLYSCDSERSYGNKLLKEITTICRGVSMREK